MRTVEISVYKFNELSPEAQEKALERFHDINIHHDWWNFVYEDFKMFCEAIGIDVDLERTYFSGFSHQGQGASFTADVDILQLIEGINDKKYLEHAPKIHEEVRSFAPKPCTVDRRIVDLIKRGWIDVSVYIKAGYRPYRSIVEFSRDYTYNECINYNNVEQQLEELESWVEDIVSELDNLLFVWLEQNYDYYTSEEAIKESILANEYEFTQDGKQF
jgi:hypothetical protein